MWARGELFTAFKIGMAVGFVSHFNVVQSFINPFMIHWNLTYIYMSYVGVYATQRAQTKKGRNPDQFANIKVCPLSICISLYTYKNRLNAIIIHYTLFSPSACRDCCTSGGRGVRRHDQPSCSDF